MTVWAFTHPGSTFAHLPQGREGVLHATLIEEQTSEHLPGVAVLGMPLQPTTQAGFHIPPASRCECPPDRFQARLPRGSPEHVPQAGEGGQDQRAPAAHFNRDGPGDLEEDMQGTPGMVTAAGSGMLAVTLPSSESRSRSQLVNTFAKALQHGLQGLDPRPIA